eukprot:TRINITY_DN553_c0_g1_i1.p1 TRINITY_DN553_c0_g1~~TRINITY_DN553_c0_g1_i1.p1  ORF type:complete len:433 (+),score=152.29 TRINITY_DN553_c0_g1_i1:41-1339(+)
MGSTFAMLRFWVLGACVLGAWAASVHEAVDGHNEFQDLENLIRKFELEDDEFGGRVKRGAGDKGVTNLDIRDALLQMLKTMRDNNKRVQKDSFQQKKKLDDVTETLNSMTGSSGVEKKIDNISTFLLRMNNKIDSMSRGGGGGRTAILETLAQESYDIISLLPTYIDNTRKAIYYVGNDTKTMFKGVESLLGDEEDVGGKKSLRKALESTETNILSASKELKDIVVESGSMAESLFERVDTGYKELEDEIKGLANVEKVLLDTADSVMDTKRKIEFGVQQIIFKVSELIELSGGQMDDNLAAKFESITRTILSNQTEALTTLTSKVEKDIGQVWRQMGIMYGQLSNSIGILEKVKVQTEEFTDKNNKNLGSMDNQVEGLTDRMTEVDDNLNYMLGQLSLVVSEFNQVKTGLGEAMEGIGEDMLEEYKKKDEK